MGSVVRGGRPLHLWGCMREKSNGGRRRGTRALTAGRLLGCCTGCPCWLPSTVPVMSPADTLGHSPSRYSLSLASVYNHTLIPINLLLVPDGWRAGRVGPGGRWRRKHSHTQPQKPRLTDCTRPALLFTLSRCGLPLVFLSNYPSLTQSMCQSKSLRVRAARARAPRATQAERPAASPISLKP